jgi:uncharacterized coiled-coil protein SlyX
MSITVEIKINKLETLVTAMKIQISRLDHECKRQEVINKRLSERITMLTNKVDAKK